LSNIKTNILSIEFMTIAGYCPLIFTMPNY